MAYPVRLSIVGAAAAAMFLAFACDTGQTIKAPVSDTQYDDPDEPPNGGTVDAVDATTLDGGPDVATKPCSATQRCDEGEICAYSVASGCANPTGQCVVFVAASSCLATVFCDCAGHLYQECAPVEGSSQPHQPKEACGSQVLDAGPG